MKSIILMKTHLPKKQLMLELMQQVLSIIWLKENRTKHLCTIHKSSWIFRDDTIVLREGDETAFGYAGKDTFEGGAGNDIIDGGAGVDTAIYKDSSSAYTLTSNDDGTVSVVHSSPSEGFI